VGFVEHREPCEDAFTAGGCLEGMECPWSRRAGLLEGHAAVVGVARFLNSIGLASEDGVKALLSGSRSYPAEGGELDVVDALPRALAGPADQLGLAQRVDVRVEPLSKNRSPHPVLAAGGVWVRFEGAEEPLPPVGLPTTHASNRVRRSGEPGGRFDAHDGIMPVGAVVVIRWEQ